MFYDVVVILQGIKVYNKYTRKLFNPVSAILTELQKGTTILVYTFGLTHEIDSHIYTRKSLAPVV